MVNDTLIQLRPLVSVILPTGGASTIDDQLAALAGQVMAPPFEVIVVANRCPAAAEPLARRWEGRLDIRVVRADLRAGVAYARNVGVAAAAGQKLLFVDDDDIVSENYVATMAQALERSSAAGAKIDLERLNPGWRARVRDVPQAGNLGELQDFAYGATLGVRREVAERIGPFDERLDGLAAEDVEWCRRLLAAGETLAFVPDAVVHYRLRTRYRDLLRQGYRYGRGGQMVAPTWDGWTRWSRTLLGAVRLLMLGRDKGERRRGAFLIGRRLGAASERHRA